MPGIRVVTPTPAERWFPGSSPGMTVCSGMTAFGDDGVYERSRDVMLKAMGGNPPMACIDVIP
jgi:hypothetical protein